MKLGLGKRSSALDIVIPDKIESSAEPEELHLRLLREEIDPAGIVLDKALRFAWRYN